MKFDSKGTVAFVAVLDMMFVLGLSLSGMISGFLSSVVYIIAFILPLAVGFKVSKEYNNDTDFLHFKGAERVLPFIAPTLLLIMGAAYLTSMVVTAATGRTNDVDLGTNVLLAVLYHALAPALLEEALFRYLPLRLMKKEGVIYNFERL